MLSVRQSLGIVILGWAVLFLAIQWDYVSPLVGAIGFIFLMAIVWLVNLNQGERR